MTQSATSKVYQASQTFAESDLVKGLLTLLILALGVYIGFRQSTPPDAVPASAAAQDFSSERAMAHIAAVAERPHPIGSSDHARVRDYILKEIGALGLKPEIQKTTALKEDRSFPHIGATVENIFARMKGSGNGDAVLLMAHYDSVVTGPGASDDGAGVATLLETMRALKAGPPPQQDVAFLFTDAEEVGLLGARGFVAEHPAAKDVKVLLNFEARGNGGPSLMFETSRDNAWLISEFAKAAPHPVANSLSDEIYRRLPNDTDLTVFRESGMAGLNFAYIKGLNYYHTELDTLAHVDGRSLQHHGSYALALARHFGNLALEQARRGDAVYFDIPGGFVIHYPVAWAVPLALLTALLFVAVLWLGFRRKQLCISHVALGFVAFLLNLIVTLLIVLIVGWLTGRLNNWSSVSGQAEAYNSGLYFAGLIALSIAVISSSYIWLRKKISVQNLTAGGLLNWLVLMAVTSLLLPGASYVFTWPLLFSLLALPFVFNPQPWSLKHAVVISILAMAGLVLLTPMIYLIYLAMTLRIAAVLAILVSLLLGLLIPHLALMSAPRRWVLPAGALLASVFFYAAGVLGSGFDGNHPLSNSAFYVMNADASKAVWASFDQKPDQWTSQFFNTSIERGALDDYLVSSYSGYMKSPAPLASLDAPSLEMISDSRENGTRRLHLLVKSLRRAPVVTITAELGTEVLAYAVGGKRLAHEAGRQWGLRYYSLPPEGLDLTLELQSPDPIKLRVTDLSYGLPEGLGLAPKPRPDFMIPSPVSYNDSTLVSKSFAF